MKFPLLAFLAASLMLGPGPGCSHIDLTPEGSRSRVLSGTLNVGVALPIGTEISVRIISTSSTGPGQPTGVDLPVSRPTSRAAEQVIGEQVQKLTVAAAEAVPFRIEYDAEDAVLRRGVNVEARVYYNGRVRFRTVSAHVVTLSSSPFPQHLTLQAVDR